MEDVERVYSSNRYGLYAIPAGTLHRPAARLVSEGNVYEPDTIDFMRNNHRGMDIVHAGAFFGDFIPGLASGVSAGSLIWSFEPTPENYTCAAETVRLNRLENVILTNAALSREPGELSMRVKRDDGISAGGTSHIVDEAADGDRIVRVPAVRIDDVIPETRGVGILQLDLEGHELAALRGAARTIAKWRPILIIENQFESEWLRSVTNIEYRYVGRLHENGIFAS